MDQLEGQKLRAEGPWKDSWTHPGAFGLHLETVCDGEREGWPETSHCLENYKTSGDAS